MYDIPFDRSFLQPSNGIRHVMPYTDTKPELTAKASMAQPVSQPAVYANELNHILTNAFLKHSFFLNLEALHLPIQKMLYPFIT
jgi:hypothetical protein